MNKSLIIATLERILSDRVGYEMSFAWREVREADAGNKDAAD